MDRERWRAVSSHTGLLFPARHLSRATSRAAAPPSLVTSHFSNQAPMPLDEGTSLI